MKNKKNIPPLDQRSVRSINGYALDDAVIFDKLETKIMRRINYIIECHGEVIDLDDGWRVNHTVLRHMCEGYPVHFDDFKGVKWNPEVIEKYGGHLDGKWLWTRFPHERK